MGFDIYIGQAEIRFDAEYPDEELRVKVNRLEREDAPFFENDPMTGHSNSRHPSYTGWDEFVEATGLRDLFFGESGIMSEHPGCFALTKEHHATIAEAMEAYRQAHPNAVPGFGVLKPFHKVGNVSMVMLSDGDDDGMHDHMLARLIWLEWWVRWALENCSMPAIYNF